MQAGRVRRGEEFRFEEKGEDRETPGARKPDSEETGK